MRILLPPQPEAEQHAQRCSDRTGGITGKIKNHGTQ